MTKTAAKEQIEEIAIPEEKAQLLANAGDVLQKARAEADLAQARFMANQNAYDAILFRIFAQCGANPDEYKIEADGKKLKFVRASK